MTSDNQKKMGMILKGYPRISETFISNEILLLEHLGFKIHIFSMRHPRELFCHESVKKIKADVDYLPQTILEALPDLIYHNFMTAIKYPDRYLKAIKLAFQRFLRTRKSATIKHLLQAGYMAHKLLGHQKISHLHAHFAHSPTSVAMFTSFLTNLPFSFTAHAKDIYTSDPRQLKEKMTLAEFVVTCTGYNQSYLKKILPNKNIYKIYHGIDLSLFNGNTPKQPPKQPYNILSVARIVPKKGLFTVYRALAILKNQGVLFKHILIGDGDEREAVLNEIKRLKLSEYCQWLGTLPHEAVLDHYKKADLFVLGCEQSSNGDRDGIPNVFVEAMAMGVPIAGTRVSAIPELIEHEKTGLLVLPKNPDQLARAMIQILEDNSLHQKLAQNARQKVFKDFNNKNLISDLAKIYKKQGIG